MDWSNERILQFLEEYKERPCIWNPKHPHNKNRNKVTQAWEDLRKILDFPCTVVELKKKRESLMAMYRSYKNKIKRSELAGDVIYEPSWFAFTLMDSFLGDVYTCKITSNAEDDQIQDFNEKLEEDNIQIVFKQDPDDNEDSNSEHDSNQSEAYFETVNKRPSSTPQKKKTAIKRRLQDPLDSSKIEFRSTGNITTDHAYEIVKTTLDRHLGEDECDIFGRLIAKKLQRLSTDKRDLMMVKINDLIYKELHEQNMSNNSHDD